MTVAAGIFFLFSASAAGQAIAVLWGADPIKHGAAGIIFAILALAYDPTTYLRGGRQ